MRKSFPNVLKQDRSLIFNLVLKTPISFMSVKNATMLHQESRCPSAKMSHFYVDVFAIDVCDVIVYQNKKPQHRLYNRTKRKKKKKIISERCVFDHDI